MCKEGGKESQNLKMTPQRRRRRSEGACGCIPGDRCNMSQKEMEQCLLILKISNFGRQECEIGKWNVTSTLSARQMLGDPTWGRTVFLHMKQQGGTSQLAMLHIYANDMKDQAEADDHGDDACCCSARQVSASLSHVLHVNNGAVRIKGGLCITFVGRRPRKEDASRCHLLDEAIFHNS